jgi:hypothetical protein
MFDVDCANRGGPKSSPRALSLVVRIRAFATGRDYFGPIHENMKSEPQLWTGFIPSCKQFPGRPAIDVRKWQAPLAATRRKYSRSELDMATLDSPSVAENAKPN